MIARPTVAAATALALFLAPATAQTPEIRARMETALVHLAQGNEDAAVALLLEVVDEAPFHGPARLQLGALAVTRSEWAVAGDHLRAALEATGEAAPAGAVPVQRPGLAWALLAEALDGEGDLEGALEATSEALRFAPAFAPALLRRSDLARRLAGSHSSDGWTPSRIQHIETALEAAREAARLAPDRPRPWSALSLAATAAQVEALARCAARRATEIAPADPAAWFLLARAARESDPEEALAAAESALAAGGDRDPALWMLLGELRAFRMDMSAALAAYAEALRLDPAAAGEMASPALDALAAGDDEELLVLLAERARRAAGAVNTRFTLARRALRLGRIEEAAGELRALAGIRPGHPAILTALHTALRRTGASGEADRVLARLEAVKAAESSAWARSNQRQQARAEARSALDRGDFVAAAAAWEALSADPDPADDSNRADDFARLGQALAGLGRPARALAAFGDSLALRPFDPEVLAAAAEVAASAGHTEAAARYSGRARLAAPECAPPSARL